MRAYSDFAKLFSYPIGDFEQEVEDLKNSLEKYGSDAVESFSLLATHFTTNQLSELQEYYIRTFDVNAFCYLDIGYVLFGEESKRGQFLLNMKSEQLKANNDCGVEFADHLPNMLTLLPKMEDLLFREELVITMMMPALKHMLDNFRTDDNYYKHLLILLVKVLEADFSNADFKPYTINQKEIENTGVYACGMDFTKIKSRKH